jgi:hypothetical protein
MSERWELLTIPSARSLGVVDDILSKMPCNYQRALEASIANVNTPLVVYLCAFGNKYVTNHTEIIGQQLLIAVDSGNQHAVSILKLAVSKEALMEAVGIARDDVMRSILITNVREYILPCCGQY